MPDVLANIQLLAIVSQNPTSQGAPISQDDFELDPAEILKITDFDVTAGARFQVPATGTLALPMGSIVTGGLLFLRVEAACGFQLFNGIGSPQIIQAVPGRTSVLHANFTGVTLTNVGSAAVKGRYFAAGLTI